MNEATFTRCCKCQKAVPSSKAVRFLGKDWCQEHYREEIGVPQDLASAQPEQLRATGVMAVSGVPPYSALRTLAGLYRVIAVVWGVFAAIGIIAGLAVLDQLAAAGWLIVVGSVLLGVVAVVTYLAIAEGIKLGLGIEANTRLTAAHLSRLVARKERGEEAP